jgi:simple sugar transport system ATP-binding protein
VDDDSRANWSLSDTPDTDSGAVSLPPTLELRGITKAFGSVTALDDVSFAVRRNTIHALLGENGAGKTTLMRIAFGIVRPDKGSVLRNGHVIDLSSPARAIAAGIGMVHQQFSLVPAMTVSENVALGGHGAYRPEKIAERIREVGRQTGLELDPLAKVADLTSAERQRLEIVRTFAHDAKVLILDEPTAVLTPRDVGELFGQLRSFADNGGSVVLITHKLQDALEHADEVSVLRRGQLVHHSPMREATRATLTRAMLGSSEAEGQRTERSPVAPTTTVVAKAQITKSVGIEILSGQILGVAALEGAAANLLRSLAGRGHEKLTSTVTQANVGFVPENRQEEGVIPEFSLTENLALRNAGNNRGTFDWERAKLETQNVIANYDIRTSGPDADMQSLSGGNQQRFVLGRELKDKPSLLVLENPTQGLDVNAAEMIHERIRTARDDGTAVVIYSSDLDELAELADRVVVVGGASVTEVRPDRDEIGRVLLGIETAEYHLG